MMTLEEFEGLGAREREDQSGRKGRIRVCQAAGCASCGSDKVLAALKEKLQAAGLEQDYEAKGVGCMGLCSEAPLVTMEPGEVLVGRVTPEDAEDLVRNLQQGTPPTKKLPEMPFFTRQHKIALEHCGVVDPERIQDYLARGGYSGLYKALTEMTPLEVVHEITASGLRGRGGGGYPTGLKWGTVHKAAGDVKYVICNADEGDPGAFMDRSVLESDPHRILEGMAIAGYAVGAGTGYIYVRAEYPLAIKTLRTAIRQAERQKVLGTGIFGSSHSFQIELRIGAGAFVCGEETALIASIEGNRGQPRNRPPYPAVAGLFGCPTLINNVETFANVPAIMREGADWFASVGTEKSKGTKVFALAGSINNTGLVEVPMGTTLRELILEIGGGCPGGKSVKAVQTGGPSGGCIPAEKLDTPVDYESLMALGSMMGSGGMIVMDETTSMIEVARFFMDFCRSESCGKCVPCRVGTQQMYTVLDRICEGQGSTEDLELLERLCETVRNTSLCGLGKSAPNPIMSTMRYFREEYTERIRQPESVGTR